MESWKPKITHIIRHKSSKTKPNNGFCRRHPKHKQGPGVCAICLTERLAKLANRTARSSVCYYSSPSSSSSSYLSYSSSSYSSPVEWEIRGKSMSVFKSIGAQDLLTKCRSTVVFLQRRKDKSNNDGKSTNELSKRGFWSKLLPNSKKGLMHSTSTKERLIEEPH